MKKRSLLAAALIFCACAAPVAANPLTGSGSRVAFPTTYRGLNGLFDASRMKLSHQASFSYRTGMDGRGTTTGLYLSALDYRVSDRLNVKLNFAYKYQPQQDALFQSADQGVIPGVSLRYQLSQSHIFGFEYGATSQNLQQYEYLNHDIKPYSLWYQGSFLNNSLQLNVRVSNQPYTPYSRFGWRADDTPWGLSNWPE